MSEEMKWGWKIEVKEDVCERRRQTDVCTLRNKARKKKEAKCFLAHLKRR